MKYSHDDINALNKVKVGHAIRVEVNPQHFLVLAIDEEGWLTIGDSGNFFGCELKQNIIGEKWEWEILNDDLSI